MGDNDVQKAFEKVIRVAQEESWHLFTRRHRVCCTRWDLSLILPGLPHSFLGTWTWKWKVTEHRALWSCWVVKRVLRCQSFPHPACGADLQFLPEQSYLQTLTDQVQLFFFNIFYFLNFFPSMQKSAPNCPKLTSLLTCCLTPLSLVSNSFLGSARNQKDEKRGDVWPVPFLRASHGCGSQAGIIQLQQCQSPCTNLELPWDEQKGFFCPSWGEGTSLVFPSRDGLFITDNLLRKWSGTA